MCAAIYSFIHLVVSLKIGPKPLPKRALHIVRSRASSFKLENPLLSLRSSSSLLRLLPRLLVTSISPFIFPSITCFRRQFRLKMWPVQLAFRLRISCRIFLCSFTISNTSLLSCEIFYSATKLTLEHLQSPFYLLLGYVFPVVALIAEFLVIAQLDAQIPFNVFIYL